MYQQKIEADLGRRFSMPVFYFTELIGLACNLKESKEWLSCHISEPFSLLRELDLC
jgi:heterodisulfide reductase subunit B